MVPELEHVKLPGGKNGGVKVPLTALLMFAGLLAYVVTETVKAVTPDRDTTASAMVVEKLDELIEEHDDVNRLHAKQLSKVDQQILLQGQQIDVMRDIADDMQEHRIKMENGH
ncbi:MAG: hypothetical protein GY838_13705 [bacterium]|nr:hypothetical protein [bacterium]